MASTRFGAATRGISTGIVALTVLGWVASPAAKQRGAPPPVPLPQGQHLEARDGDLISLDDDARVRIVRRRRAVIRTIFNPANRTLILLVDRASPTRADGRVDARHSYTEIHGQWPLPERWEGAAVIEDYQTFGQPSQGMGLVLPQGVVQILSHSGVELFKDAAAIGSVTYGGASGNFVGGGVGFDDAERLQLAEIDRNTSRQPGNDAQVSLAIVATPPGELPVRVGSSLRTPKKVFDVQPTYPEAARRAGIGGVVLVELTVSAEGQVTAARVLRGVASLDQAAVDAAMQWRYEPELVNGKAVPFIVTAPVAFRP